MISRLRNRNLFLEVRDIRKLIELWTLFENETGAGETKLKDYSSEKIVIQLRNNPLRRAESSPHAHCGFYRYYIRSFLNGLYTIQARLIQREIERTKVQALKVTDVVEEHDAEDNCVFVAQIRPEILTRSFDTLYDAYEQFYKLSENEDYSPCASVARSALVSAQMETIKLDADRPPRQFFKVFKEILPKGDFRRMDHVYHVTSKYVHIKEGTTKGKLTRSHCWEILQDIRRSVYAFENLNLTEEQRAELRNKAMLNDRLEILTELVKKTEKLNPQERDETVQLISRLRKGELTEEHHQARLVGYLNRLGCKVREVAKPILTEEITTAIGKRYGL